MYQLNDEYLRMTEKSGYVKQPDRSPFTYNVYL